MELTSVEVFKIKLEAYFPFQLFIELYCTRGKKYIYSHVKENYSLQIMYFFKFVSAKITILVSNGLGK